MKRSQQVGDYRFLFFDEAAREQSGPILATLIERTDRLDGFEAIQAKKGKRPHVFRFRAGGATFVGKWSRSQGVLDRARNLLRVSRGRRAWDNAARLLTLGFDTPQPVAYGERRRAGVVRRSILITRELANAWKLHQFLYQFCGDPESREIRRSLMRSLGKLIAGLHRAGVHHSDLRSANILVEQATNGLKLHLVDTEAVRFRDPVTEPQRLKNFGDVNFTFAPGVTITDRMRVFRSYADALGMDRGERKRRLRRTIAACERSMHAKIFKPQLRPYRIPSGRPYREQVETITRILEPRLRSKAGADSFGDGLL